MANLTVVSRAIASGRGFVLNSSYSSCTSKYICSTVQVCTSINIRILVYAVYPLYFLIGRHPPITVERILKKSGGGVPGTPCSSDPLPSSAEPKWFARSRAFRSTESVLSLGLHLMSSATPPAFVDLSLRPLRFRLSRVPTDAKSCSSRSLDSEERARNCAEPERSRPRFSGSAESTRTMWCFRS